MRKEKTKIYGIEILLVFILGICTLLRYTDNKIILAIIITLSAILVSLLLKRERVLKVNKKKIVIVMTIFAILYVAIFYMLGLYTGFTRLKELFSINTIINFIIPISIIIISTERIRDKLLLWDSKLSKFLIIGINTIIEIAMFANLNSVSKLENFLALVGFISFAAIANNMMYNYIQEEYGKKPVIIFRLITTLYLYIIPKTPDVYIFYRTFLRIIYPLIIFLYIDKYYNENNRQARKSDQRTEELSLGFTFVFLTILIGLISCRFYCGILVIGSKSMTGTIDKGDIIFYKKSNTIKKNDIVVYDKENMKIVHRVIDVKNINQEQRYYTKGDANKEMDEDYVTNNKIEGKVLFKIRYIRQPTLWLRNMFNKEG